MKNIDNIIFDLGNVILNIDYQNTIDAFEKIGVIDASSFYSKSSQLNIFSQLETGRISKQDFVLEIQKFAPKASATQIINAWNAILQDLPNERLEVLKKIKDKFKIFLLSNTNSIHIEKIIDNLGVKKYK